MNWREKGFINVLLYLLLPLSLLYYVAIKMKDLLYLSGILRRKELPCKVISVGNITLGGTGKTPLVILIAGLLRRKKPAILTRGYGRKNKRRILYASDNPDPKKIGDESFLMSTELKDVPVIVASDRHYAGLQAIKKYGAEAVILDDGFQRRFSLKRDLDIVLIDCLKPFGTGMLFPAGTLREPLSALMYADIIVLSKSDAGDPVKVREEVKKHNPNALIVESVFSPVALHELHNPRTELDFKSIKNKKIMALSAVGNPDYFERIIFRYKPMALLPMRFMDHHDYSREDMWALNHMAPGYDFIITTEKDAVKLRREELKDLKIPVYVLKIEFLITKGQEEFAARLKAL